MPTFLTLGGTLRVEENSDTVFTLRRKGWVDAPARPTDNAQWKNGKWMETPSVPVPESVSPYQFRAWCLRNGISMSQIDSLIGEITDQTERELLRVQWEYGSVVTRDNQTVERFGAALGMTALQIDKAFREAALIG